MSSSLAPFSLQPIFSERIWGSQSLAPWYPDPEPGKPIGEAWLTAETCTIETGPEQGSTLADLTSQHPAELGASRDGEFPLLIKILFPREKLSVQVHPNDAQANALGLSRGKTECWYILSAEPGAEVAVGFREPLTPEQIRQSIADGTLESQLRFLPVRAGDMVYVDAGTVHAIGPGVVILEIQQYSDITYRLYDYGRPRELHVDAGVAVTRTATEAGLVAPTPWPSYTRLIASPYFIVDRFSLSPKADANVANEAKLQIFVALAEGCALQSAAHPAIPLIPGHAVILPANAGPYQVRATTSAEVIRITQP